MRKSVEELLEKADELEREADEFEEQRLAVRSKLDQSLGRLKGIIQRTEATARRTRRPAA